MRDAEEDVLRRALEMEAAKVEVHADALEIIRARTARRARWWPFAGVALTAAVATAAVVALFALVGGQAPRVSPPPGDPAATAGTPAADPALAIYYVGEDEGRQRLYREFRRLPVSADTATAKLRAAVTEMLRSGAHDPGYASAWPAGTRLLGLSVADGGATVDVSAAPAAAIARQQLVWTVAAVLGGDPAVRLRVDGDPVATLRKAPALDTLAALWLINPQHGETVTGPVIVHVAGAVFEATAQLRVLRPGGAVVEERTLTLSAGAPARGEVKVTLNLAPGEYTVEVYEISARDGAVQHRDDHTVTVR
ncbi:Gmad2 immunoglobulin-like domain-containing protein [Actinomycetes bacterium KLBMP 9797]